GSTGMILPAATASKAIDSGLRATDVTCGGMIAPRPSPSWPKYELIWRARLAPRVTRRNLESAASRRPSIGGFIIVSCRPAAMRASTPLLGGNRKTRSLADRRKNRLCDGLGLHAGGVDDQVVDGFVVQID